MLRSSRVALFTTASILALATLWFGFRISFEKWYRLRELDRLARKDLVVTENGYAIDETRDLVEAHRDRLAVLGVFFEKSYELGALDRNDRKHVIEELERKFPSHLCWELDSNNVLRVWDLHSRESEWDDVVKTLSKS